MTASGHGMRHHSTSGARRRRARKNSVSRLYEGLLTEQSNPLTLALDQKSPLAIVDLIHAEDRRALAAVSKERREIAQAIEMVLEAFRSGGRLIYVGAGTSGRLGVLDAAECPPTFGVRPGLVRGIIAGGRRALVRSIEGAEDKASDGKRAMARAKVSKCDVVMGIATCSLTPYVHGALAEARLRRGAKTIFLSCTPRGPGSPRSDLYITPLVGPEVITGSTRMKAGTATKLVLNAITTGAMVRWGKTFGNLMVDLRVVNRKLEERALRILRDVAGIRKSAAKTLLRKARGEVKTALAMRFLGVGPSEARRRLQDVNGFLRRLLPPSSF